MNPEPIYSVVVPFYNEAENLPPLIREIDAVLAEICRRLASSHVNMAHCSYTK